MNRTGLRRDLAVVGHLFLQAAALQRKRAVLTVAAIAWGTVTVVMLLAFGQGLREQLDRNQRGLGVNLAVLWPGQASRVWEGLPQGRRITLRLDDVDYLRGKLPDLAGITGEMTSWSTSLSWGARTISGRVSGAGAEYGEMRNHYPQAGGRFFNQHDVDAKRRVVFLGDELARDLFGERDPVGETLEVGGSPYLVIGVMQPKKQMGSYGGPDSDHATIPITTFSAQFGQLRLDTLVIQVADPDQMPDAMRRLRATLGARLKFDPEDEQALGVWDTVKSSRTMRNLTLGVQIFLGLIGGLTLIVGGVGVANIMYAVVKERTREIGVQMAIGARRAWITGPFVLQGLLYTLVGGLAGMILSLGLIVLVGLIPTEGNEALEFLGKPTLSWPITAATAAILGLTGILAGYFPARRAATVDPVATLRYE